MSIRNKFLLIIAVLITVPLLILGALSYNKSVNVIEERFINSTLEMNLQITQGIKKELDGYTYGIKAIGENIDAKEILIHPEYEPFLRALFVNYHENFPAAYQIYMGTTEKDMIIEPHREYDADYDPTVRPWYTGAQASGQTGWTDVYTSASTGEPSISGYSPVYNEGEFIGVVAASLSLETFSESIENIQIGETGYAFVLDSDGTIIFHRDETLLGSPVGIEAITNEMAKGQDSGYLTYEFNGVDKLGVYKYLPEARWHIFTTIEIDELESSTSAILRNSVLVGIIALIAAVAIGFMFANSLTNPIKAIVATMKQVEDGDMTVASQVRTRDEIGMLSKSFNNMVANVGELIGNAAEVSSKVSASALNLASSAEQTSASTQEVAKTVDEIAKGATEQAEDAEKAVSLTSSLDTKLVQLNDNSKVIADHATNVQVINEQGGKTVDELLEVTNNNIASSKSIEEAVMDLEEKSASIGSILETITSIADQTNLLALNASIEAARAGEHGKGFAVVADEIRKLAEESSKSADQIGEIIKMIQNQTVNAVAIVESVRKNTDEQAVSVENMSDSFKEVSNAIEDITGQIRQVDGFINEILGDKDNIVSAIANISAVSEETAAGSEEVAATTEQQNMAVESIAMAADELSSLSEELNNQISKFTI